MTLFEFFILMESTFSPLLSKENYLLELIDNLLQEGIENPLTNKISVVHKITNDSADISVADARFINLHSDTAKFEKYIENELSYDESEDMSNSLCNELRPIYPDITFNNVSQYCAEAFLRVIKERISKKEVHTKAVDKINDESIYDKISFVVSNLSKIKSSDELPELAYEPLNVRKKIKDDFLLFNTVNNDVIQYYEFVDSLFREKQNEPQYIFEAVSKKIKNRFIKNDQKPLSECFDYLTNWLKDETSGSREACRIVISYFIQSCEVFYAATE